MIHPLATLWRLHVPQNATRVPGLTFLGRPWHCYVHFSKHLLHLGNLCGFPKTRWGKEWGDRLVETWLLFRHFTSRMLQDVPCPVPKQTWICGRGPVTDHVPLTGALLHAFRLLMLLRRPVFHLLQPSPQDRHFLLGLG